MKKNNIKNIFNDIKKNYFFEKEQLFLSLSDQYKYSFDFIIIIKITKLIIIIKIVIKL